MDEKILATLYTLTGKKNETKHAPNRRGVNYRGGFAVVSDGYGAMAARVRCEYPEHLEGLAVLPDGQTVEALSPAHFRGLGEWLYLYDTAPNRAAFNRSAEKMIDEARKSYKKDELTKNFACGVRIYGQVFDAGRFVKFCRAARRLGATSFRFLRPISSNFPTVTALAAEHNGAALALMSLDACRLPEDFKIFDLWT